jgi:hypothetical protein
MLPNRIVVILTPFLAGAGGLLFRELAKIGVHFNSTTGTAAFITGALAVVTPLIVWLYNWGKHEANAVLADMQPKIAVVDNTGQPAPSAEMPPPTA